MPSSACDWSSDVCSSDRSEEHTSELQSRSDLVCRLLLEKKKKNDTHTTPPPRPTHHACTHRPRGSPPTPAADGPHQRALHSPHSRQNDRHTAPQHPVRPT